MASRQIVRYADILTGYIPADPNSFPDNLSTPDPREDRKAPVTIYDGYNFMPTAYGYKSYFGVIKKLLGSPLAARVDYILLYQTLALKNFLVAMCDTGIWVRYGGDSVGWTQLVTLDGLEYTDNKHYPWSYTVLENKLYMYRQGEPTYWLFETLVADPGYQITAVAPTFLNMEAQLGIFRAGDRLGFWDSANATAWSSIDDFADFEPNIESGAGIVTFGQIIGKIINILAHGDGFVIYCTKSILYVQRQPESLYLWEPYRILQDTGIAYRKQVACTIPDTLHFAYTATGIFMIQNGKPELIAPDAFDYFKTISSPKYLAYLEGRYLFINILDDNFITGNTQYSEGGTGDTVITLPNSDFDGLIDDLNNGIYPELTICDVIKGITQGVFLPGNSPNNPLHPEDYGPVTDKIWSVIATGIDITSYPYIKVYAGGPGGELLGEDVPSPAEGPFEHGVTVNYTGNTIYIEWHTASANPVTITVSCDGVIIAIIPAGTYDFGYGSYSA